MATDIISVPVVPSQPLTEYYPLSALGLFKEYTRESFRLAFPDTPIPSFDIGRRVKNWFDTSVSLADPEADVTYYVFRATPANPEVFTYQMTTMPVLEAATVNFAPAGTVVDAAIQAALKRPLREMPVRLLFSNEEIVNAFTGPMIRRTDRISPDMVISWTEGDRLVLNAIAKKLGVEI